MVLKLIRVATIIGVSLSLGACALAPGLYVGNTDLPRHQIGHPPSDPNLKYVDIDARTIEHQRPWQAVARYELPTAQGLESAQKAAAHYVYHVGRGDILSIVVWNHPELTNPYGTTGSNLTQSGTQVRANGTIFFPFAGIVHVAGLTVEQIRRLITERIKTYIANPQVGVRVLAYKAHKVYVTGFVNKPGIQYLTNQPLTVMDAINAAGGLQTATLSTQNAGFSANHRIAVLTRDGKHYLIDLKALYSENAASSNVLLKAGDTLYVPDNWYNQVFVMGAVQTPKTLAMNQGRMTLAEALSDAGGVSPTEANSERIFVIRGIRNGKKDGKPNIVPVVYHLNASSADALLLADEFQLHPRDIVYVSTNGFVRFNRVISQILPTISSIYQTHALVKGF